MAVIFCLTTGLTTQAQVSRERRPARAQNSEQMVTSPTSQHKAGKQQRNDKQSRVINDNEIKKKKEGDKARNDTYRNYRIAVKKLESAQKKVNNLQRKLESLQQDLVNERVKVAEKITSGNGLTVEEASALEKALQEVDQKYGAKITGARNAYERAQVELEHAKSYMEAAEIEYKR